MKMKGSSDDKNILFSLRQLGKIITAPSFNGVDHPAGALQNADMVHTQIPC